MKQRGPLFYLLIIAGIFVALAIVLFFFSPWAPLFLLASIAIQAPIIIIITRTNLTAGYRDRAFERRAQYQKDGDAQGWLDAEQRDASGVGFRFWSSAGRAQSLLNRADALSELERGDEAAALLAELDTQKLPKMDRERFDAIVAKIRNNAS